MNRITVCIVDYGVGNLRSLTSYFSTEQFAPVVTSDPSMILNAQLCVLPGVGSFDRVMSFVIARGIDRVIKERLSYGKLTLGICMGLQIMFDASSEGERKGLSIFNGFVDKIPCDRRIAGWGALEAVKESSRATSINVKDESYFYFNHGYQVMPDTIDADQFRDIYISDLILGLVIADGFVGCQFHPENSQRAGNDFRRELRSILYV